MSKAKDKLIIAILSIIYYSIPVAVAIFSIIVWNFIGLAILLLGYFASWLIGVHGRLHMRIFDLEFDNKQSKERIIQLEDGFSNLSNIVLKDQSIYWTPTPEQKESQRRSFVYGNTKLSNPNIMEELVNEIAESNKTSNNSKRTLFDDLWKIEPPVKSKN